MYSHQQAQFQVLNFIESSFGGQYVVIYDMERTFVSVFKSFLSTKNLTLHFYEVDPNEIMTDEDLYNSTFGFLTFRDLETNSTWNVLGRAVRGPLQGRHSHPHSIFFRSLFSILLHFTLMLMWLNFGLFF